MRWIWLGPASSGGSGRVGSGGEAAVYQGADDGVEDDGAELVEEGACGHEVAGVDDDRRQKDEEEGAAVELMPVRAAAGVGRVQQQADHDAQHHQHAALRQRPQQLLMRVVRCSHHKQRANFSINNWLQYWRRQRFAATCRIRLRISTARRIFPILYKGPEDVSFQNRPFARVPSNTGFLAPSRVHNQNGISTGSAVLAQLTVVPYTRTHQATPAAIGRILALRACDSVQ